MSVNEYKTQQNEMKDFMQSISPSLKANVCKYIFIVAITQNPLLNKILKNKAYIDQITGIKFKKNKDSFLYERIIMQKELTP